MTIFKNKRTKQNEKINKAKKEKDYKNSFDDTIIDWTTFYRRNIHRFVEHYFGIKLHFYQKIILYLMHKSPLVVLLCARAVSKSFITALYACAVCVLYPKLLGL